MVRKLAHPCLIVSSVLVVLTYAADVVEESWIHDSHGSDDFCNQSSLTLIQKNAAMHRMASFVDKDVAITSATSWHVAATSPPEAVIAATSTHAPVIDATSTPEPVIAATSSPETVIAATSTPEPATAERSTLEPACTKKQGHWLYNERLCKIKERSKKRNQKGEHQHQQQPANDAADHPQIIIGSASRGTTSAPTTSTTAAPTSVAATSTTAAPTSAGPTEAETRDCSKATDERLCKVTERSEKRIQKSKQRKDQSAKKKEKKKKKQ